MTDVSKFFPLKNPGTYFIVKNIAPGNKRVRVFNYPILNGDTRDLLDIPAIGESHIRMSLLKGELLSKIRFKELIIVASNIDLLQFSSEQKSFLQSAGVIDGLEITSAVGTIPFLFRQNADLIGDVDGINRIFTTAEKFINGSYLGQEFRIIVKHNGRTLEQDIDYLLSESGGPGTGYDTVTFISFVPNTKSRFLIDYVVRA